MASRLQDVILRGTRAAQPAATTVAPGTLYFVTAENVLERSNGTAWETYSGSGSGGSFSSSGGAGLSVLFDYHDESSEPVIIQGPTGLTGATGPAGPAGSGGSSIGPPGIDGEDGELVFIPSASGPDVLTLANRTRQIGLVVDGGGSVLTTGLKGFKSFPVAGTITRARLLADQSGSIVIDIWKDTYANFPPTVADTITASAKPTLSTAQKSEDTTLTGWTTAVSAGDVFGFNVDSVTTITRILLELTIVIT